MAAITDTVKPGDIISSDLFNRIIELLNEHDALLSSSSSGGTGLSITQLVPASGPYRVGDPLSILGQNFQFGIGAARVFFNGTQVPTFQSSSSDTRLDFTIPNVPGVTEVGTQVDLVVLNQTQSVTRQVVLKPIQNPLQGNVTVTWTGVSPATFNPGDQVTFSYSIVSGTNNSATWNIDPQISVAANAAAWNAQVSVRDSGGNELNPRQVTLAPGQQVDVQVRIAAVPSGTNGVIFGLTVNASSGPVSGSSAVQQFTVGVATTPPDSSFLLATVPIWSSGALVGDTLTVPGGASRILVINADLTVAGNYTVTRKVVNSSPGWTVNLDSGTTDAFTINAGDVSGGAHALRLLHYAIAASLTATTPAQVQITVQRQGNTSSRSIVINVVRS